MNGLWGISVLALGLGMAAPASAQDETLFADITVTGTRTPQDAFDVPVVVTVIDAEQIEEILATDIKDLVRFEPGVTVPSSPSRFTAALASTGRDGNSGFSIRGLGGNRVLFQVDGVRVPDGFSFGPAAFGRGDYVDLDLLQSVEILRGPGSALYGSDGLAGVVSFITKDPSDFLAEDENFGARLRAQYASADDSWSESVVAAGRWGDWSALVSYTRRDGHEQDNQGDDNSIDTRRTAPNPQDIESNSALARIVYEPNEQHRFRLTADYGDRDIHTEVLSARAVLPPDGPALGSASVLDLDGVDQGDRKRVALDYTFSNGEGFISNAFVSAYAQRSSLYQFSAEDRNTAADRTRITTFDNDVWGAATQLESRFATGAAEHTLIYGADYSVTDQEGTRDGTVPPVGEAFPTRAFPNTEYTQAGVFIQDQIDFMDGRVSFFPALRYDAYELNATADALYTLPVADQSGSRVTPRFGIVAWPTERFGVFFNYAEGFKAPSPSQVNNGFSNPIFGYTSVPNPDLRPETSEALELGVRWRNVTLFGGDLRASANVFGSWYEDFIDQIQVSGSFAPLDPAIFQYINFASADVRGAESRADIAWENGFGVSLAVSYAEGDVNDGTGAAALESIEPWRIVAGVSYNAPSGAWGGQLIGTYSSKKDERDTTAPFIPDAFAILDATAYWNISDAATLRVGLFNITDEKYWWWNDVRGVSTAVDAYTQPGRNFSASIAYRF
ncbi:MAG: TonB-dependent hemoglobin/transferrin/lactoferrin family receptor [Hyphomonadaceae bacterium]|nr:TonB-dependent hemoglobin/transferrin/lactoferrin family receptor [Hyphomonadaceae bacterium]